VAGEVVEVRLSNISKAAGRYNFHVEVLVRVTSGGRPPGPTRAAAPGAEPAPLPVRLPERVYWGDLSPGEQAALAPDGPRHRLHLSAWRGWTVGGPFDEAVVFSGPDLAFLPPGAP
jgi:hypothetical protein